MCVSCGMLAPAGLVPVLYNKSKDMFLSRPPQKRFGEIKEGTSSSFILLITKVCLNLYKAPIEILRN